MKSTTKTSTAGLFALLSMATSVAAHGFVTEIIINGQSYPGFDPYNGKYADGITQPWRTQMGENSDGPAIRRFTNSLICQVDAKAAPKTAPAPAGSKITFHWNQWPEAHKGPILTYLAECNGDCSAVDSTKLQWFKIEEAGLLDAGKNYWATDLMMDQGDAWNIQLPKNIKSGNYVMRHEMISLESTNSADGVQFYPTCFNLEITGGTGQSNPQGVSLIQAYGLTAPGLTVGTKRGDAPVYSYNPPGPPIDRNIGATASNMVNTGASSNGRKHIYPNSDKDPYATSGKQPNYSSSAGQNTAPSTPANNAPNYNAPTNNAPNYNAPNNTPAANRVPANNNNNQPSRAGDANRKHCDDGYVQCRVERGNRKFKRGSIIARTPQADYRSEYCYQKFEVCLNAALYGAKAQPNSYNQAASNTGYKVNTNNNSNNGYRQPQANNNNNGYRQPQANSNNNGNYYQSNNNGYNSYY
ncbi:hypothetical protein TWF730_010073 [Orbilia blumenaviensis]|uniref:lytic cellulose monooxygenase (C4-dehydrogenating) n=1 Tax=Orbilia blumenaviensis TaxID=1796055 RepID=A0AAV9UW44_9PEZI